MTSVLYSGDQKITTDLSEVTDKLNHIMLHQLKDTETCCRLQARIQDFTLGGALLGEESGFRLGPHRFQGSARRGDRGEAPGSSWEL
jgi:hypothetical protein